MARKNKNTKICFAASSGGHWEELMRVKDAVEGWDVFYVTEHGAQSEAVENPYTFDKIDRHEKHFPLKFLNVNFR